MKTNGMNGLVAAAASLTAAAVASGDVVLVSQERFISGVAHAAWEGLPTQEDSFLVSALDFGPFDQSNVVVVNPPDHPNRSAHALAEQHSSLTPSVISATGRITAGTLGTPPQQYGLAESSFTVTFDVDAASPFRLLGTVFMAHVGTLPTGGAAMIQFTGPGVNYALVQTSFGTLTLDETGVLNPGRYTLVARTYGDVSDASTYYAEGTFNVSLTIVPAPDALAGLGLVACCAARRRRGA